MTPADEDRALLELGRALVERGYQFTAITPETHRRVVARGARRTTSPDALRDVFGWSRAVAPDALPAPILALLRRSGACVERAGEVASAVRFASLGGSLFAHSAYPTTAADAVFFGPDTYRFCRSLTAAAVGARRVVDVGCGSGAGALVLRDRVEHIVLADINPRALRLAAVNAALAGAAARCELVESDVLAGVTGAFDLVIANPPYLADASARAYRDGGGELGTGLAMRIAAQSLERLARRGRLVLYSGAPIVAGVDLLRAQLAPMLEASGARWTYEELDPDVFGDELDQPAYAAVERIAAVLLRVEVR